MVHSLSNDLAYIHWYWIFKLEKNFASVDFLLVESPLTLNFVPFHKKEAKF